MARAKDLTGLLTASGTQFAHFSLVADVIPAFFDREFEWQPYLEYDTVREKQGVYQATPNLLVLATCRVLVLVLVHRVLVPERSLSKNINKKVLLTTRTDFPAFFNVQSNCANPGSFSHSLVVASTRSTSSSHPLPFLCKPAQRFQYAAPKRR